MINISEDVNMDFRKSKKYKKKENKKFPYKSNRKKLKKISNQLL